MRVKISWISSIEPSNGMKNIYKTSSVYKTIKKNTVDDYYRKLQSIAYFFKNRCIQWDFCAKSFARNAHDTPST